MKKALAINEFNIWHEKEMKETIEKHFETDYVQFNTPEFEHTHRELYQNKDALHLPIHELVLEQLTKKDYDLIITPLGFSWQKEDMRGFDLTENVREHYANIESVIFSYRSFPMNEFEYGHYLKPQLEKAKDSFYQFSERINNKQAGEREAYCFGKFLEQLK